MLLGPWSIGQTERPAQKPDLANMGLGVVDGAQVKIGQAVLGGVGDGLPREGWFTSRASLQWLSLSLSLTVKEYLQMNKLSRGVGSG